MTVYYVDGAVGSDANDGLAEGAANAWLTIDKAMSTVLTDDKIFIKASAVYSEQATIITAGGLGLGTVYEGYTTTPGDQGKATMVGTTYCITTALSAIYHVFRNLKFTGASSHGVNLNGSIGDSVGFENCEFTGNGGNGAIGDNNISFVSCIATNNTAKGFDADNITALVGCIAYGNGTEQVGGSVGFMYKCILHGSTGSSSMMEDYVGGGVYMCASTIDGGGLATIGANNQSLSPQMFDNVIYNCGIGVNNNINPRGYGAHVNYNLMNSNTVDYSTTFDGQGSNDVTAPPRFTDEATDDYTLGYASSAKDSGLMPGGIT